MKSIFFYLQILTSLALVVMILLQSKGTGLGKAWGMSSASSFTRRGLERFIFKATFVVAGIFIISSFLELI